jgi:bis(5'-nucleosyl)-tetraphosphatase (symmetrical)
VLGDLVNRGPRSLATLQRLRGLGDSATCLLGNHDWHLLAAAHGVRPVHATDTLDEILAAPIARPGSNGCAAAGWRCSSTAG